MSDIATVADGLVTFCAGLFYPNGSGTSITGDRVIVRRGWLLPKDLNGDCSLKTGVNFVTIMPLAGGYKRIGEALGMPWQSGATTPPTVSLSLSGRTVTVSLAAGETPGGLAGIRMVSGYVSKVAAYAVQPTDTAQTIAADLASQIPGATVSGAAITIPPGSTLSVATMGHVAASRVTRRQRQTFQVTLWTSSPATRDTLGFILDSGMSGAPWFADSTGRQCLLTFAGSSDVDTQQASSIYRRVFRMPVTFDTTQEQQQAQLMFGGIDFYPDNAPPVQHYGDQPLF